MMHCKIQYYEDVSNTNFIKSYMMLVKAILDSGYKNIFQYPMDVNIGNPIQTNYIKVSVHDHLFHNKIL